MDLKKIVPIVMILITVVIIFSFVGNIAPEIKNGANSIYLANNCSYGKDIDNKPYTYNQTDGYCYNSSGGSGKVYAASGLDIPFKGLFAPGGIVVLVLMAGILLFVIAIAMKKWGGKSGGLKFHK
jgi:hypothetical protein